MFGQVLAFSARAFGWMPRIFQTRPTEWLRAAIGASLALGVCSWICLQLYGQTVAMILLGPVAASAILLFAVASGALAQPWSLLGSYLVASLTGVGLASVLGYTLSTAWLAVGVSLVLMYLLRCLHPPGGAVALTVVLAGPVMQTAGFMTVLPVMLYACCLLFCAAIYNNLTGVRYPKQQPRQDLHRTSDPSPELRVGFTDEDLDRALDNFGEFVDITRHDLEQIIRETEKSALRRRMGDIRAEHVMSRDIRTVGPDTTVMQAIRLFRHHHVKTLPVVDAEGVVQGIVSLGDLLAQLDLPVGRLLPKRINVWSDKPLRKLMTRPVVAVDSQAHVVDMIPLLSGQGLHCLPVLENGLLVGLVTQTDLIAALHRDLVANMG